MENQLVNSIQEDFFLHLLKGNRHECSELTRKYLSANPSIKDLYEEIFKNALYKVGMLWETNQITVATEHLATAITEGILNELYEVLEYGVAQNKKVVLTCVENELHQVGIKMVADVFEIHGWETYFLGTGIPQNELIEYLREVKPIVLAISLSVYFNFQNLLKTVTILKKEFPALTIIAGGQAFTKVKADDLIKLDNTIFISDLYQLDNYLKTI